MNPFELFTLQDWLLFIPASLIAAGCWGGVCWVAIWLLGGYNG